MLNLSTEAKVGLFVILGLILLVYMSLRVGGIKFGRGTEYEITVRFDTVAGLDRDAPVRIAGVEIGRIKDIILEEFKARLILSIHRDAIIKKDFTALIKTQGLLGERYLELIPGSPDSPILEHGGELTRTISYTDPDRFINQLSNIADDIQLLSRAVRDLITDKKGGSTLKNILKNLEQATLGINRMLSENRDKFNKIVANIADFSEILKDKGQPIAENLESLTAVLDEMIYENKKDVKISLANLKAALEKLKDTVDSIDSLTNSIGPDLEETVNSVKSVASKIERGEGSIGRLVNEDETVDKLNDALTSASNYMGMVNRFKTIVAFRSEILFDNREAKNFFSLTFQPAPQKYYLFEVVDNPRDRIIFDEQGGAEPFDEISYNAQIARRFNALTIRGGILESTGGVGLDYSILDNRMMFTFEASDFDRGRNPHLKLAARYNINKYFFITGGYDDFVNRQGIETPFIGLGLRFEDEDLRDLLVNLY